MKAFAYVELGEFYQLTKLVSLWPVLVCTAVGLTPTLTVYGWSYLSRPANEQYHPFLNFRWQVLLSLPIWLFFGSDFLERLEIVLLSYGSIYLGFHLVDYIRCRLNPTNTCLYPFTYEFSIYPGLWTFGMYLVLFPLHYSSDQVDLYYFIRPIWLVYGFIYLLSGICCCWPFIIEHIYKILPRKLANQTLMAFPIGSLAITKKQWGMIASTASGGAFLIGAALSARNSRLNRQSKERIVEEKLRVKERMHEKELNQNLIKDKENSQILKNYYDRKLIEKERHHRVMEESKPWYDLWSKPGKPTNKFINSEDGCWSFFSIMFNTDRLGQTLVLWFIYWFVKPVCYRLITLLVNYVRKSSHFNKSFILFTPLDISQIFILVLLIYGFFYFYRQCYKNKNFFSVNFLWPVVLPLPFFRYLTGYSFFLCF